MPESFYIVLSFLWDAASLTFRQLLILLGPGLALAFILHYIAEFVERRGYDLMGQGVYLGVFGGIGTIVHELGHAVFCVIFGHRINEMRLFKPDPNTGSLGFVSHSYNPKSNYQTIGNFFIGIGPILFGSVVIFILSRHLLGQSVFHSMQALPERAEETRYWAHMLSVSVYVVTSTKDLMISIFVIENLTNWKFFLFLYLTFCIGSSVTLSGPDIEGALTGFGTLFGIVFVLNAATSWFWAAGLIRAFEYLGQFNAVFCTVMTFTIAMNIIAALILIVLPCRISKLTRA